VGSYLWIDTLLSKVWSVLHFPRRSARQGRIKTGQHGLAALVAHGISCTFPHLYSYSHVLLFASLPATVRSGILVPFLIDNVFHCIAYHVLFWALVWHLGHGGRKRQIRFVPLDLNTQTCCLAAYVRHAYSRLPLNGLYKERHMSLQCVRDAEIEPSSNEWFCGHQAPYSRRSRTSSISSH
jgi:hypothetical protein